MYAADEQLDQVPSLKDKVLGRITAPAALWQVVVIAVLLALVVILTGVSVTGRVARVDSKLDALTSAVAELDKRLQKLDGKLDALRAAATAAQAQQKPATGQGTQQQTPSAPGQITPKKKP